MSAQPECADAFERAGLPGAGLAMCPWDRDMIAELGSPCAEFRVVNIRICGRQMYEAFRVSGKGTLYSFATTDLDELRAVLREACPEGRLRSWAAGQDCGCARGAGLRG